ncbi:hypothetical protein [Bacillus aquiflavi]|uniref:hypothetical protein n=1 Tax=Bacillus aquiflavi TaxID=2672567 RepID=UPI001FECFCAD|nr:hypothetical protein [Bacillus aquiflavi]
MNVDTVPVIYMLYSFPVILIYGVITSSTSDIVSEFISTKIKIKKLEIIISGVLHVVLV